MIKEMILIGLIIFAMLWWCGTGAYFYEKYGENGVDITWKVGILLGLVSLDGFYILIIYIIFIW